FKGSDGRTIYYYGKWAASTRPTRKEEAVAVFVRSRHHVAAVPTHRLRCGAPCGGGPESQCLPSMCAAGEKAILNGGFFERHHPYGSHPRPRRDALAAFERPAEGYRGWIVPAGLVNPQMKLRIVAGG